MKPTEQYISTFLQKQFPSFYNEEGSLFMSFVNAYYEWLETENQTNYYSRKLTSIKDIDTTLEQFISHFREKYLVGLPFLDSNNQEELVKFNRDLYRAKGTEKSVQLLFALLYDERNVEIFYPKTDILRASDGKWIQPLYLEVTVSDRTNSFVGKEISGSISGAKAFVESVVRKQINDRFFDVLFISDIRGSFQSGDLLTDNGILIDSPILIGSLIDINILNGGANNSVGDILQVIDTEGREATVRVTALEEGTGKVQFTVLDGGSGYVTTSALDSFTNTIPIVSNTTMVISTPVNANTSITGFSRFETVAQPAVRITYTGSTGSLANVGIVRAVNATAGFVANTQITSSNSTVVEAIKLSGSFSTAASIRGYDSTNTQVFTATISSANEFNITGNVVFSNNSLLSLHQVKNGPFVVNTGSVVGQTSNTYANIVSTYTGTGADFDIGSLSDTESLFLYTDMLGDINVGGVPFMDILLDGTNSNVASNGYGFSKAPFATLDNYLETAFTSNTFTIGTIDSLTNINLGQDYNVDPPTIAYNKYIAGFNKRDYILDIANTVGAFIPGELVTQNVVTSTVVLGLSSLSGSFIFGEGVVQVTTNATGYITAANSSQLTVVRTSANNFSTGLNISGTVSSAAANVSSNASNSFISFAKGSVKTANNTVVQLKRLTFNTGFDLSSQIIGSLSGATANVVNISLDSNTAPMGDNAVIRAKAVTAGGIISDVVVVSSGVGYNPNNTLLLTNDNNPITATGTAVLNNYGTGIGYWSSDDSFLNVKYLHDNKYYQDYSYEVIVGLSLNRYKDLLKQVFHIAGTELFGRVSINSVVTDSILNAETEVITTDA